MQFVEGRIFHFTDYSPSSRNARAGTQAENLAAGPERKTTRGMSHTGFVRAHSKLPFLYNSGPPAWRWDHCSELGPPPSISSYANVPTTMSTGSSDEDSSSSKLPSSWVSLICVKLIKTNLNNHWFRTRMEASRIATSGMDLCLYHPKKKKGDTIEGRNQPS